MSSSKLWLVRLSLRGWGILNQNPYCGDLFLLSVLTFLHSRIIFGSSGGLSSSLDMASWKSSVVILVLRKLPPAPPLAPPQLQLLCCLRWKSAMILENLSWVMCSARWRDGLARDDLPGVRSSKSWPDLEGEGSPLRISSIFFAFTQPANC